MYAYAYAYMGHEEKSHKFSASETDVPSL